MHKKKEYRKARENQKDPKLQKSKNKIRAFVAKQN
jgi:hypothetical protein